MRDDLKFLIFSLAAMALSFGLGFLLGTNSPRREGPTTTNNPDAFRQFVATTKPNSNQALLSYRGVLSELSPQRIVLVDDRGQAVTFPLDTLGALTVAPAYRKRLPDSLLLTTTADRSIFTPGTRVSLDLTANFTTNQVKITRITLIKEQ